MNKIIRTILLIGSVIAFCNFANASDEFQFPPNKASEILKKYALFLKKYPNKRVAYTITTSTAKSAEGGINTWVAGKLLLKKRGPKTILTSEKDPAPTSNPKNQRYWSNRKHGVVHPVPFDPGQTDELTLRISNPLGNPQMSMFKTGASIMPIKILGVIKSAQGHIIYGTYNKNKSMVMICLKRN